MNSMTDFEMTKLCAQAMGYPAYGYAPFSNDAQAMALVKKFKLIIDWSDNAANVWMPDEAFGVQNDDLNRAIVECVARMQKERS